MNQFESQLYGAFASMDAKKNNRGGKRTNAGRPAPHGRKIPVGIRLTPDVLEFCKQHPDGFTFLESLCRKSKAFREWARSRD